MALPDPDGAETGHGDGGGQVGDTVDSFLQQSYLTYIIPFATHFSPEEALGQGEGSVESKIAKIEQRDQLFFDETVDVYLILRALCHDEQTLRLHLPRLVLSLDAHIMNSAALDRDLPPASEVVYTGAVEHVEQAIIVAGEAHEGGGRHFYALWKLPVLLSRPRIRLQLPYAVFCSTASLKIAADGPLDGLREGYMASGMPSAMNLLEAFADDPMLGGVKPRLSAQRVSKVAPVTKSKDTLHRINGLQSLRLKIYPVLHTRVRFSRPNTTPPSSSLIALLEIDFTPFFECEVALDRINLSISDGTVEDLNIQDGMSLPLSCVAHDHLTFLYKLSPPRLDHTTKTTPAQELHITIEALVLVRPAGEPNPCTPRLVMTWPTPVDFTPPVNPGFGQPMTKPIQRSHRPSQLSISGGVDAQPLVSPSVSRPDALPSLEAAAAEAARTVETALPDFGITMTFSGPAGPVRLGAEFTWTVFVVNHSRPDPSTSTFTTASAATIPPRSSPTAPTPAVHHPHHHPASARKLMLLPIHRRSRRNDQLRVTRPPSSMVPSAAATATTTTKRDPLIADAVLDEAVVHAMQRSSVVDGAELVCLSSSADSHARVGPLAPGACAVAELRFLALRAGVVGLEAVRVVDLGSQEHVDVRDLPLVVVVDDD